MQLMSKKHLLLDHVGALKYLASTIFFCDYFLVLFFTSGYFLSFPE